MSKEDDEVDALKQAINAESEVFTKKLYEFITTSMSPSLVGKCAALCSIANAAAMVVANLESDEVSPPTANVKLSEWFILEFFSQLHNSYRTNPDYER